MGAASLLLAGERILHGLTFLQEHGSREELVGKASTYVSTEIDWRPAFEGAKPDIKFPRMRFVG